MAGQRGLGVGGADACVERVRARLDNEKIHVAQFVERRSGSGSTQWMQLDVIAQREKVFEDEKT
jgi:hypothetical protein